MRASNQQSGAASKSTREPASAGESERALGSSATIDSPVARDSSVAIGNLGACTTLAIYKPAAIDNFLVTERQGLCWEMRLLVWLLAVFVRAVRAAMA